MNKMRLDFQNEMVEFDRPTQKGTECSPGLKEKRDPLLKLLGVNDRQPAEVCFDFEAKTMSLKYSIPDIDEKAVYSFLGFVEADMSNVYKLMNAYINGQIPESLFKKMLIAEGEQNEADPVIKAFLDLLPHDYE